MKDLEPSFNPFPLLSLPKEDKLQADYRAVCVQDMTTKKHKQLVKQKSSVSVEDTPLMDQKHPILAPTQVGQILLKVYFADMLSYVL